MSLGDPDDPPGARSWYENIFTRHDFGMDHEVTYKFFDREFFAASALFAFALAVRLILLCCEPQISRDGCYYIFQSMGLAQEEFPRIGMQAPLFPGILKAFFVCGISPLYGGLVLNLLIGAIIPLLIVRLAKNLSISVFWCWFAGFVAAAHPQLADSSIRPERENLYILFSLLMALALTWGINRGKFTAFWLAGGSGAAAALARFEGWEALPLVVVLLITMPLTGIERSWKKSLRAAMFFVGGWVICFPILLLLLRFPLPHYIGLIRLYIVKAQRALAS